MKKILQISNYLYPNIGGIEQVARDIANAISANPDLEQKIICFNETARDNDHICRREETVYDTVDGVEVIRCGCITKKASQSISLTFGRELKKVLRDFDPDIVIFHYPNPFQAAYLLRYLKDDTKLVLYWHLDIVKQKMLGKLFRGQNKRLINRADRIIAASPQHIDGSPYLSGIKDRCEILSYCIDERRLVITDEIRRRAEAIREENAGKIICFGIGRHVPYKGFTYLIKASKMLDDRFRIYIGGQGELTEELKREAAGDEKIRFTGRLDEEDLVAHYLAMDMFCFPSITKNEGFGLALAEAMYLEKPAVTFNIPGSGVNYVNKKDETGLEVPNGDSKAYAGAMLRLAEDADLRKRMGKAAKNRVETLFSREAFRQNMTDLINDL